MKKLEYQLDACEQIVNSINDNNKIVRLQAPTGSGKTYITSLFIERILQSKFGLENSNLTFVYVAPSTGQLDYQGFKKISSYLSKGLVSGFSTEYIGTSNGDSKNFIANIDRFERKKVYFIGWDILRAKSRIFSDNEQGNIFDIVRNTHELGTKIVLIVDEAHREYPANLSSKNKTSNDSKMRQRFLEELSPAKIIEMTATMTATLMHKQREGIDVLINAIDVKKTGAIKQEIIINEITDNLNEKDKIVELITSGLIKRNEINDSIAKINSNEEWNINPLVLIQIPDKSSWIGDLDVEKYYLNLIKVALEKYGLVENDNYTYWLDGKNKSFTKDQIASNKSEIEVLIFKQAIATGWDVPRACVLIKLRDPKNGSKSFEIQTLGRILRNPFMKIFTPGGEQKLNLNDVTNLNSAFVFTNDKDWKGRNREIKDFGVDIKEIELKQFQISEKATQLPLNINIIKIDYDSKDYSKILSLIFEETIFINSLIKKIEDPHQNENEQINRSKIDGVDVANQENVIKEYVNSCSIKLSNSSYGLFYIYSQYINAVSNVEIIKLFFDEFARKFNINRKKLYWFVIDNFKRTFIDEITLQQKINQILGQIVNKTIKFRKEGVFKLNENIEYDKNIVNLELTYHISKQTNEIKKEFINSYELEFNFKKAFKESKSEFLFYYNLFEMKPEDKSKFHIFKNKTNVNNSFYIEYFKISENREAHFFPDFIITTKNKIFIVECKGLGQNNIDDNSSIKMNTLSNNKDIIFENKEVVILKVGLHKNLDDLEIHLYNKGEIEIIRSWNKFQEILLS